MVITIHALAGCLNPVFTSTLWLELQATDKLNAKSLEAAASYAQSLAQWAFIIIGGSLALFVGNSHRWPRHRGLRATYLLFLFAWASLGISVYFGTSRLLKNRAEPAISILA
jgi:hypothetical protein